MKEEYLSIETLEKINKLQKELDKAINKKETLKGGLDDVYRKSYYDLKARIDKLKEYINNLYENEYLSYGNKEEIFNILRGVYNE